MERHTLANTGGKMHKCKECHKSLNQAGELIWTKCKRTATFFRETIPKSLTQLSDLKQHMTGHSTAVDKICFFFCNFLAITMSNIESP